MFSSTLCRILRRLSHSVLVAATAFLFAANAQAREKVTLQLLWDHQFQFAGFYAAQWLGYYEEAGLEVDIRPGVTPDRKVVGGLNAVRDGRADFGLGGGNILVARDQGAPLVILAPIFQQSAVRVYAKAGTNLYSPADLLDLRVARKPGGVGDAELQSMLRAEGLDPDRMPAYPQEPGLRHLAEGRVDAAMGYSLASPWVGRNLGLDLISLRPSAYGVDFYGDTLFTRRDLAENNPELVKRFVDASLKGWRYALENPREISQRIASELERTIPVGDFEAFNLFQAEEVQKLMLYPHVAPGHINPARWRRMHAFLKAAGAVAGEFDVDTLIFDPDRRSRERARLSHSALIVGVWTLFVLVVFTVLAIWMLRRTVARRTAALQKSEETLSLFQDSATEDFALFDRDLKLLNANAASISRLGEPLERMIGKTLLELLPHLAGTERYDHYRNIARSGGTYDAEIAMSSDDGEIRYRAVSAFRAGDGLGVITRDITDRKRAEAALRESEETLSLFQDSATEDFALFDRDLKLLNANAPALAHFGEPLAQAVGKPLLELLPHLAGTERYARFLKVASTRGTYDDEVEITGPDGETSYRAISAFPAGDGVGVITRDIADRKRAEAALRESEGRLNAFFAEAPAELVMFDRDLRYLKVNERLARINGLPAEDHIGKSICDIAPDLAPKVEPLFRRILETAEPLLDLELEGEVETDPGIKHTWALSIFPILGGDGTPQGVGSISINITERKRAERELELLNHRLEKLVGERTAELRATQVELLNAERLATLGQLTATVAHELRNPLATIRTSVFSLRSRIQDGAGEAQTTLRRIDRNIVRCDRIISELLDFSANQEPHLETVDLNRCIAAWVEDYEASEGTRLRLAISDGAVTVRIDQDRLHQVLVNLLDNASQALEETPGRGRRDAEIAVRTRIEGGRFVLEVADDGPGIPDDVLPRIFEPLFSTKGFGVGLGLPLVKKIIDQHGGDIEVVTGVGDGTTFRVHLPLTKSREAAA